MKTDQSLPQSPPWWDETKLERAYYAEGYSGWIINLGDGTCRYANGPLLGVDPGEQEDGSFISEEEAEIYNAGMPRLGDRVKLVNGRPDPTQIIERYNPENEKSAATGSERNDHE